MCCRTQDTLGVFGVGVGILFEFHAFDVLLTGLHFIGSKSVQKWMSYAFLKLSYLMSAVSDGKTVYFRDFRFASAIL
jgi:hypothetical protein